MQLGTRWTFGQEPPAKLPEAVVTAIREIEAMANTSVSTGQSAVDGLHQVEHFVRRWTLTWLEGLPHVELDPESGSDEVALIRFDPVTKTARIISDGAAEDPDDEE